MYIRVLGHRAEVSKKPNKHPGYNPACYIDYVGQRILIDSGPDVLYQLNQSELIKLTSLWITHGHQDSISGLGKLNSILESSNKFLPVYVEEKTWQFITHKFSERQLSQYLPNFIQPRRTYQLGDLSIRPLRIAHSSEIFPTLGFNFDKTFIYSSDGFLGEGGIDEYELQYWSNNILAVLDGAYWDHQVGRNHTAVLPYFSTYMLLNNTYTYLIGYGNQWPKLSEAIEILDQKLKEYKKSHPECQVKEISVVKGGQQFFIDVNYLLQETLFTKPSLDTILSTPEILYEISKRELLMLHLRCHQLWHRPGVDNQKVLQVHILVLKEFFRRGISHNKVDTLDEETYRILGKEIKFFNIYDELPNELVISNNVIKVVGSSLKRSDPTDLDLIVTPQYNLEKVIDKLFQQYNYHLLGSHQSHGDVVNLYSLILKKNPLCIHSINPLDLTTSLPVCSLTSSLVFKDVDMFIVEPLIPGKVEIVQDKEQKIVYERVITDTGVEVITDLLVYKKDYLVDEILFNRLYFMHKKWLDQIDKTVYLPYRWVVEKKNLFKFLASLKSKVSSVIIRPASSTYYDGKFILELSKTKLKPIKYFPPLKAAKSAYHELEFFNIKDAWEYFGKYYITEEGQVRVEVKYDGLRVICQNDGQKQVIYFEDSLKNRIDVLPSFKQELIELGDVILDGELMEKDESGNWKSRHELLKWAIGKDPGSDENLKIFVFDILYYKGEDLHTKPWEERFKVLQSLKLGSHFELVQGWSCSSQSEFIQAIHTARYTQGSDGAMLKSIKGDYPLTGRTNTWAKFKNIKEIDVIVLDVREISKSKVYSYTCGYQLTEEQVDQYTPIVMFQGKSYGVIGKTFNTKEKCSVGDIITVGVLEIKKNILENKKIQYTWFHPRFLYKKPDKKEPDGVEICERIYESKTHPLQSKSYEDLFFIKVKTRIEPQWTIQPGDKFEYCIQAHLRGLDQYQTQMLDLKKVGYAPEEFQPTASEYEILNSIIKAPWQKAIKQATETESSHLLQEICNQIDLDKLSKERLQVVSKISPISIHQDLRIVVLGNDYFEGGHWTTPGNQFKVNRLLLLDQGIYSHFMIKSPHSEAQGGLYEVDWVRAIIEPVVRGPKSWLTVGSPEPLIVPPSAVGATPNKWAVFNRVEFATGEAGRQTARSGSKHFKLFRFDGKILNGFIVFMYAPLGNKRVWVTMKPKNQDRYAEEFKKPQSKFLDEVESEFYRVLNNLLL